MWKLIDFVQHCEIFLWLNLCHNHSAYLCFTRGSLKHSWVVYRVLNAWKDCMNYSLRNILWVNDLPRGVKLRGLMFPPIFYQSQVWSVLCLWPLSVGVVVETQLIWLWLSKKFYIMPFFWSLHFYTSITTSILLAAFWQCSKNILFSSMRSSICRCH